ncbi:MAG: IS110 family transposase [Paludibacterium sp.]|uniref:IS110 family transposase n=1 Tax=Paludibacterium sp. TaxID=1917523 RepID=UPI0025DFA56A|nr:IS110 family transposase [Paludibacterium sp.]MBV8047464.1 IS110 family transposase [Paludibacterium sp.]
MKITRIGIDLAKTVFQVHGVDSHEKVVLRRQLRRNQMAAFFAKLTPCLIGMEACASSHYWARVLTGMGHTVKLIAPQFVKPYVKGNKNDANDAEAICEAVGRPNMRFVAIKSVEQQDIQALHRIRTELVQQRTAKVNHIRGLLGEYGIMIAQRIGSLRKALPDLLEDAENGLTTDFKVLLHGLREDLVYLDGRVAELDRAIQHLASTHAAAHRLQQLRGIGPITATALVAALGDGKMFRRGRDAAAWVGLVPRQHSSGGKDNLLGISKRGNAYLRTLLIHGARAVVKTAAGKEDRLSVWVQSLCRRRNKNVAAVALANKTMRMAWALLTSGAEYQPEYGPGSVQPA